MDAETGLCYYGYRYYSPEGGRWLSRDPLEEEGGLNLFAFTHNNGISNCDATGLAQIYLPNGISYDPGTGRNNFCNPDDIKNSIDAIKTAANTPTGRVVIFKFSAAMQCIGGAAEVVGGASLIGVGGAGEVGTVGVATPIAVPAMIGGGILIANGADNMHVGLKKLFFSIDDPTKTEQIISAGLVKAGVSKETADGVASNVNTGLMIAGGGVNIANTMRQSGKKLAITVEVNDATAVPKSIGNTQKNALGELVDVNVNDSAARSLAERLGGRPSVRFARGADNEFDAVSDFYVAQTKPAGFKLGSAFRNQAKATFVAAKETGRRPYFHFDGPPDPAVIKKIMEYAKRYGIEPVIDLKPL